MDAWREGPKLFHDLKRDMWGDEARVEVRESISLTGKINPVLDKCSHSSDYGYLRTDAYL